MADKTQSTLKKLASVSQSLNQASDQMTSRIAEVESALREYKLGIEAWVDLRQWEEYSTDEQSKGISFSRYQRLGYGKKDGKWGLLTCIEPEESAGETYDLAFLREATREVRFAAIDKLPALLEELTKKAIELSQRVSKQAEKARQIAADLNKKVS